MRKVGFSHENQLLGIPHLQKVKMPENASSTGQQDLLLPTTTLKNPNRAKWWWTWATESSCAVLRLFIQPCSHPTRSTSLPTKPAHSPTHTHCCRKALLSVGCFPKHTQFHLLPKQGKPSVSCRIWFGWHKVKWNRTNNAPSQPVCLSVGLHNQLDVSIWSETRAGIKSKTLGLSIGYLISKGGKPCTFLPFSFSERFKFLQWLQVLAV